MDTPTLTGLIGACAAASATLSGIAGETSTPQGLPLMYGWIVNSVKTRLNMRTNVAL